MATVVRYGRLLIDSGDGDSNAWLVLREYSNSRYEIGLLFLHSWRFSDHSSDFDFDNCEDFEEPEDPPADPENSGEFDADGNIVGKVTQR
jgi:hypothetical protein